MWVRVNPHGPGEPELHGQRIDHFGNGEGPHIPWSQLVELDAHGKVLG